MENKKLYAKMNYKTLGSLLVGLLLMGSVMALNPSAFNGLEKGKSEVINLYLFEKDGDWQIVEDGAIGKAMMNGKNGKVVVTAHNLDSGVDYTYINYRAWDDVEVIGSGVADEFGDVVIHGESDNFEGKYWIVLSSDVSESGMLAWNPSEYLFEYNIV